MGNKKLYKQSLHTASAAYKLLQCNSTCKLHYKVELSTLFQSNVKFKELLLNWGDFSTETVKHWGFSFKTGGNPFIKGWHCRLTSSPSPNTYHATAGTPLLQLHQDTILLALRSLLHSNACRKQHSIPAHGLKDLQQSSQLPSSTKGKAPPHLPHAL